MIFCPKCNALLLPRKDGKKVELICFCGYVAPRKQQIKVSEQIRLSKVDEIEIVDKSVETLPKTDIECPKCKHLKAFYWLVQTRAADEAATRFFKCIKCNHTWREYN